MFRNIRKSFFLLMFILLITNYSYSEISGNELKRRNISIGVFSGFNYGVKYNNINLFFPKFDFFNHSRLGNKFLGGIYLKYKINKRLSVSIQIGYNEY